MAFYQTGGTAITYSWVDVIGNTLSTAQLFDATHFFITDTDGNFTEVFGTGFTYNAGAVTGGTITGMQRNVGSTPNGETIGIFSLNAATFWTDTGSQKFAAVLNGNDVFELSQAQLNGPEGTYAIDGYGGGGTKTVGVVGTSDDLFFIVSSGTSEALEDFNGVGGSALIQLSNINHFVGGSGTNTAFYSHLTSGVVATIQGGAGTVNMGANGTDTLTNIQALAGTPGSDVFYVDSGLVVNGAGGFDYLIELTAGVNLAYGTNFTGISEFVSNTGTNEIDFTGDTNFAYVYGSTGNDKLVLGNGGGYLFGEGGTNTLYGALGTNLLVGGSGGTDSMYGGLGTSINFFYVDGNDTVLGGGAFNTVIELVAGVSVQLGGAQFFEVEEFVSNSGANSVTVANTDTEFVYLYGGSGNDTLSTGSGGGYLFGEGGSNTLTGGGGLNVFIADGGSGVDTMTGGSGSNIYYIDANSSVHGAGTFNNVIELQQSASLTLGSAQLGTDVQQVILNSGTNSADFHTATSSVYLYGGAGNDTLFGGTGNDFLYGGTGANTFKFAASWGQDTIEDWTAGTNSIIDLTGLAGLGVHAIADLTQTITSGHDAITSSHTGANGITLLGVGAALTAGSFHFA